MIKFPSIDQFRNVVKAVRADHDYQGKDAEGKAIYEHRSPYPTIYFTGTVKLHGTNASIVKYKDGPLRFQSRERELSLGSDNYNFALSMSNKNLDFLFDGIEFNESIAVFGEWCGSGVQSGVAISNLPKMFVIFAVVVDGKWEEQLQRHRWDNAQGVYGIGQFAQYGVEIDFNNPEQVQNFLVETTEEVEAECPCGAWFGVDGVGEGIVWKASYDGKFYQFKVKGEKHSVSKVKTLASVDVELVASIKEFAEKVATEQRFEQGYSILAGAGEVTVAQTGAFLQWVNRDVLKEESDTLVASQLDFKKVAPEISKLAKVWFFKKLDQSTTEYSVSSQTQPMADSSEQPADTLISSYSQLIEIAPI